ncbi:MAG: hypothetical protein A3K30_00755 [Deltaproteobacteria bacterium RBG_13_51_10]|nr:MAG: hypothetical protein A3K30_00755 [Deltaproteobacteria bacterium RBG_13_51_10]
MIINRLGIRRYDGLIVKEILEDEKLMDESRRNFLIRDLWRETFRLVGQEFSATPGKGDLTETEDYFESFETCYPLLSEAGPLLMEEARKLGLQTEGKSKLEIAKEIFSNPNDSKKKGKEGGKVR